MDFAFSEEQDEFRETLQRFFAERVPPPELRRVMDSPEGYDPALWKQMAEELGLQGVVIPEAFGGQGFGFLELGIVLEEMGRVLLPGPYLASAVLATHAILTAGSPDDQTALLPGIAAGETVATLALVEESGRFDPDAVGVTASPDGRLSGRKLFVLNGAQADLILVTARAADGAPALYRIASDASGVEVSPVDSFDPLRRYAHVQLDGAQAIRLGEGGNATAQLERVLHLGAVAVAAGMVGSAQRCLDMAVAYAKERIQFGRPIASFQAIKHKAADVLLEVESARSAAYWSWWVAENDPDTLAEAAHVAKSACADALLHAAAENVQIHGGIGFTWEHDAQLYFKRAKSDDVLLGDATWHRARLADRLL